MVASIGPVFLYLPDVAVFELSYLASEYSTILIKYEFLDEWRELSEVAEAHSERLREGAVEEDDFHYLSGMADAYSTFAIEIMDRDIGYRKAAEA